MIDAIAIRYFAPNAEQAAHHVWEYYQQRLELIGYGPEWRCAICGFIVDTNYKATKPSIEWSTRGRA